MKRLNYYNYFTEIEEHFVRRRGKHMFISPLDWSLVATWKEAGIPLHVALRGIDRAFDAYYARPIKPRLVNSIFYCHQEVMAAFEEYRESQVGARPEGRAEDRIETDAGQRERVIDFLKRRRSEIEAAADRAENKAELKLALERARARLEEMTRALERPETAVDFPGLERDLALVDMLITEAVEKTAGEEQLKAWEAEAKAELKAYKKSLKREVYEKILRNLINRKMRASLGIAELSLFYA